MLARLKQFRWSDREGSRDTPASESRVSEQQTSAWVPDQRFLSDAAGVVSGAERTIQQTAEENFSHSDAHAFECAGAFADDLTTSQRTEIVFIDGSVTNYSEILIDIDPQAEIVVIHPGGDGLQEIATALEGRGHVDAIHVISHGGGGELQLGNLILSSENLCDFARTLESIGDSLTAEGKILFYGLSLGDGAGEALISTLSELTGADVAASNGPEEKHRGIFHALDRDAAGEALVSLDSSSPLDEASAGSDKDVDIRAAALQPIARNG